MAKIVRSNKFPASPTLTGATISGSVVSATGTITANTPALNASQTWNAGGVNFDAIKVNVVDTAQSDSGNGSCLLNLQVGGNNRFRVDHYGTGLFNSRIYAGDSAYLTGGFGIPAGGTQDLGLNFSTTAHFGVYFGSGAPTLSAAKGSLYLRSDGSTTNNRMYVNTDGATTWTAVTTAA